MQKFTFSLCTLLLFSSISIAQTGPGGVGTSTNNIYWFDASTINQAHNTPVSSWVDRSNGHVASALQSTRRPYYQTNTLNNRPALLFDGANDYLYAPPTSAMNTNNLQWFVVGRVTDLSAASYFISANYNGQYNVLGSCYTTTYDDYFTFSRNSSGVQRGVVVPYSPEVIMYSDWRGNLGTFEAYHNNNFAGSLTGVNYSGTHANTRIGCAGNTSHFLDGLISEFIVFRDGLNSAQEKIIHNYLGAKYLIPVANDIYAYEATHGGDVAGIGRDNASNLQTDSRGSGIVQISNPSDLNDGEFLLWGNDDGAAGTNSTDVPASYGGNGTRLNRVWRAAETGGDVGTVTLSMDLTGIQFGDPSGYELLVDADGVFAAGATIHTGAYNAGTQTITFTGINLSDGDFFTLANTSQIISITSGDWHNPSTWNCNCVPGPFARATIDTGDVVSIINQEEIGEVQISLNGTLTFNDPAATFTIHRNLIIDTGGMFDVSANNNPVTIEGNWVSNGNFNPRLGTVTFGGTAPQTLSGPGPTPFYNLDINNTAGVSISSGAFTLINTLTLVSGTFHTNNNPFTIISNSTSTGRIGPIPTGSAVLGTVIVQRNLPAGNADYRNVAPPVIGANLSMWDEIDLYMSGPGFPDGCAYQGGVCWSSVKRWDPTIQDYVDMDNYTAPLNNLEGYAIFLGDDLNTFSGSVFRDVAGEINSPEHLTTALPGPYGGMNLVGNPYASAIDFDLLIKSGVRNWYYIFDPSTGNFEWYENGTTSGGNISPLGLIASGQGFWVEKSSSSSSMQIRQSHKVSMQGPFVKKINPELEKMIRFDLIAANSPLKGNVTFLFAPEAMAGADDRDIRELKSPLEDYVSLFAYSQDGNKLRRNALTDVNFNHEALMGVKVSAAGTYYLEPGNLDNFREYNCVTVEDLETGKVYNVLAGETIPVEISRVNEETPRFKIRFSMDGSACSETITAIQETENPGYITILESSVNFDLPESGPAKIQVFNLTGQLVFSREYTNVRTGTVNLDLGYLSGIHMIVVETPHQVATRKVLLQRNSN